LRAETHIADFIEEESAAIGLLKLANFVVAAPVKLPLMCRKVRIL